MIFNYFKIAWRNLIKYKFISGINLFGLTVGLTCCLLILTFILSETSYDKFNPDADRVYRVTRSFNNPETGAVSLNLGSIAPPFGPLLKNDFKEIEDMTRIIDFSPTSVRYEDKMFNEQNLYVADDHVFNFFKIEMLKGDPKTALSDPFTVMMTDEVARKYFGNEDPMNKTVRIYNQFNLKVTGIYKPFPANSHMHPSIMASFVTLNDTAIYGAENLATNWGNNSFFTFIKLPAGYDPNKLASQFPAFLDRHMHEDDKYKSSQWTALALQKLPDIHLRSHTDYEAEQNGDIKRVYVFSAIALFILLIACINYMNLSTARSTLRAREIGIRKAVGARRKEIIIQFLTESVLITWLAMIIAFALTTLLIPSLNKITGQTLSTNVLLKPAIAIPILLVPFVVGIISGIYPAIFMSSFQPARVLKGLFKVGGINISFRKVLVTLQFAISIILLIATGVVFEQMRYMHTKALGFNKDHIVTLPYTTELNERFKTFRDELLSNSDIKDATRSSRIPTGRLLDAMGSRIMKDDTLAPVAADIKFVSADQDFMNTYGVKVVAGRGFSRDFSTDTSAFLLNEAAVKVLGFTNENIIGKDFGYGSRKGKIIGVFNDFHFESLHQKIVPLVLLVPRSANQFNRISVKIGAGDPTKSLAEIQSLWKRFVPDVPYEYTFLDENFAKLYQEEQRQQSIFTIFSCVAIFIACLGLLGLSAFAISQRIKEIGIRKVLGASVGRIVALLSKDFLILVGISAVVAFLVAGWAMTKWLQDFAYRISMPWWMFVVAAFLAGLIALATISFQAIKAAVANPVKSLRTE